MVSLDGTISSRVDSMLITCCLLARGVLDCVDECWQPQSLRSPVTVPALTLPARSTLTVLYPILRCGPVACADGRDLYTHTTPCVYGLVCTAVM